jgi:dephospho-CoA kinase
MIIGVTGTLGSGKGTVVDYLVGQKGYKHLSVTAFMKSVALSRGVSPDRMTYHNIANEYRELGPTKLVEATLDSAAGMADNFVVEALHTVPEVQFVQSRGGIVIGVDADLRTRYGRVTKRGSDKDKTTFEAFKKHEELEMNPKESSSNNLAGAIKASDYKVTNSRTLEGLHAQIDAVLAQLAK